jgi:hypothetical protein
MQRLDSGTMLTGVRPPHRSPAVLERDAALARVGRVRRLVLLGSAALSAAFAGLVSTTPLGKASASSTTSGRSSAAASTGSGAKAPALPPLPGAGELGLQGPSVAPSAANDPGAASSSDSAPSPDSSSQPAPASQPPAVSGGS